jgi:hypothetical protein
LVQSVCAPEAPPRFIDTLLKKNDINTTKYWESVRSFVFRLYKANTQALRLPRMSFLTVVLLALFRRN